MIPEVYNYKPYNNIDACSKIHDIEYLKASEKPDDMRKKEIIDADKKVLQCYDKFPNEDGYTPAKLGINSKMTLDKVLPIVSKAIFGKFAAASKY